MQAPSPGHNYTVLQCIDFRPKARFFSIWHWMWQQLPIGICVWHLCLAPVGIVVYIVKFTAFCTAVLITWAVNWFIKLLRSLLCHAFFVSALLAADSLCSTSWLVHLAVALFHSCTMSQLLGGCGLPRSRQCVIAVNSHCCAPLPALSLPFFLNFSIRFCFCATKLTIVSAVVIVNLSLSCKHWPYESSVTSTAFPLFPF